MEQLPPAVSIIVPARNEEACLAACLRSLVIQAGVEFEIIVVDDGSTDRTRAIAESFSPVQVISPPPLPPGWSGKCNAVQAGADTARGEWLLFTDADTVHAPGSVSRAVAEAQEHRAGLLSYSPRQEVHGVVERALMTLIFAELAARYRPRDVCDPSSPAAAANGQFLLVRREVYEAVGGHAAVARTLLEDVALAQTVKRSGRCLRFRYGGDAVQTRMYRSLPALWEGWTKNLALLFPDALQLAARRGIEFTLAFGGIAAAVTGAARRDSLWMGAGLLVAGPTWLILLRRVRKAHFGVLNDLLAPLALPLFSALLLRSRAHHRRGEVAWKGRTYGGRSAGVARVAEKSKRIGVKQGQSS